MLVEVELVCFDIVLLEIYVGGSLIISIEELEFGFLFLCFVYQMMLVSGLDLEEWVYIEYVKFVYYQLDIDCVWIICMLVVGGEIQQLVDVLVRKVVFVVVQVIDDYVIGFYFEDMGGQ